MRFALGRLVGGRGGQVDIKLWLLGASPSDALQQPAIKNGPRMSFEVREAQISYFGRHPHSLFPTLYFDCR